MKRVPPLAFPPQGGRLLLRRIALAGAWGLLLTPPVLAQSWTPELMMTVRRVGDVAVSPDGKQVVYTVGRAEMEGEKSEWVSQLYLEKRPLTFGSRSSHHAQWSPDGRRLAFLSSRGGKDNVYLLSVDGGEASQLTDDKSGVMDFAWAPGAARIAFRSAAPKTDEEEKAVKEKRDVKLVGEDPRFANLSVISLKDRQSRRLTEKVQVQSYDWSPDGRQLAISHQLLPGLDGWVTADISVVDVETAHLRPLLNTAAAEADPSWSPDGKLLACTISDNPPKWGFANRVHVVNPAGGAPRPLAETPDNESSILGWAGSRVIIGEAYRTVNRVYALAEKECQPLTPADRMVDSPSLRGGWLGFTSQTPAQAPQVFVSPLEDFQPRQVSAAQTGLGFPATGKTEVIRWKAPDSLEIEGLLTLPKVAPAPLLVIIHGGPSGVYQQSFLGNPSAYPVALFHEQGYAVLRCNVRGSSGYGQKFRFANYQDWGGGDYRDILAGVDAVVAQGVADPQRMGVMGWSYGGAMTCWITTQTSRFKAASVGAGIVDLVSLTGTTDVPSFVPDYFGGEYWEQGKLWSEHSPLNFIKGVTTPTFIQHGEVDVRVPVGQGYELYNALKRQGLPVRMAVYPRQGHGFTEPKMTLAAARHNLEWFARYLLAGKDTP